MRVYVNKMKRKKERKSKAKIERVLDQTRFSSLKDFIFDPFVLPPEPFRSLKYSIGTMAKRDKVFIRHIHI